MVTRKGAGKVQGVPVLSADRLENALYLDTGRVPVVRIQRPADAPAPSREDCATERAFAVLSKVLRLA